MRTDNKAFFKQVLVFARANLKTRYRKTWAGFVWVVMSPIIVFSVQATIFSHVLKTNMTSYAMFLVSALLPWIFLVQTIEMCAPIINNSSALIKAFPINPLVFLIAQILDNVVNFLASLLVVTLPVAVLSSQISWGTLMLPIPTLIIIPAVVSISTLLAVLQVYFADTKFVLSFVFSIIYFVTPIFYPSSLLPLEMRRIVEWNPFYLLIDPFRKCLFDFKLMPFLESCGWAITVSLIFVTLASLVWNRKKDDVYFRI